MQREAITRTFAASPLVRAVYASRTRAIPVVYHPRYIAGRVARVEGRTIVLDPPAGIPIVVQDVVVGTAAPAIPVGTYVTLPVSYTNGYYTYAQPAYYPNYGYNYGYAPQYAYAPPMYCNGNSSSLLYAALLPAVVSALTGNGSSFNTSDLTNVALGAALGGNTCGAYVPAAYNSYYNQPVYATPNYTYVTPAAYTVPITYAVTQAAPAYYDATGYGYTTPYDNCLYSGDEDGDENSCMSNGYTMNGYSSYSPYAAYAPQQVQGVVVGRSGDMLMVLGSGGTPTFVYAAPALQSGFSNGPLQPGAIVDAYGYYSGNTFIATALV